MSTDSMATLFVRQQAKKAVSVLEAGDIYFFYRPRYGKRIVHGLHDIFDLCLALRPRGGRKYRLIRVGGDRLPGLKVGTPIRRGTVDAVTSDLGKLRDALGCALEEQKLPSARPAGEGVYRIVRHVDHTHLIYALEFPRSRGEVQRALRIEQEASYVLSIEYPTSVPFAQFPPALLDLFAGRQFIPADPVTLLDYRNAHVLLSGVSADVAKALHLHLRSRREKHYAADILRDVRLKEFERPLESLLTETWR